MALNLKKLSFQGCVRIHDREVTRLMEWLLGELADPEHMPLGMAKDSQRRSNLASISVQVPVYSTNGLNSGIAAALSEVFLDERHYPMLKDVVIQLTTWGEKSSADQREAVELAMLPCTEKGIFRLLWQ
jgi:hypothetical protein